MEPKLVFEKAVTNMNPYSPSVKAAELPYLHFATPYARKLRELWDIIQRVRRMEHDLSLKDSLLSVSNDHRDMIVAAMKRDEPMIKDVAITFAIDSSKHPRIRIELDSEATLTMFVLKYSQPKNR